ncbi:MAG TPA: MerR family transcriptional regulator [Bacteroidales bacterium]|jgi:DNA-binding transcriptional MerR regulator|nr:MerR family transcriptional regulator [Bacteroidales bacterium]
MALRKEKVGRLYYRMGEVADIFGVNVSLIRYYEKEFDIIKPHRNKKGNRQFTQQDVDNFHKIFYLVKEKGFTIEGAKAKLKEGKPAGTPNNAEVVETLRHIKRFLLELRNDLGD